MFIVCGRGDLAPTLTIKIYGEFRTIREHFIYVQVEASGAVPAPVLCCRILVLPPMF